MREFLVLFSALALASTALAPAARADDVADEAELRFQLGAERYKAGDYLGALEHFLASNRLAPNPNVLFNVARSYEHLGRYPDAFRAYVQARDAASPALAKQIDASIERIAPKVAVLDVRTEPAGATIYLDRKELGARGSAPRLLGLAAGKYRVIAELPGYESATSEPVAVQEGSRATITLKLKPLLATVNVKATDASTIGAEVRIDRDDGPPACLAPCSLEVIPGHHSLRVRREGYKPLEIPLDLDPREVREVRPQLSVRTGGLVVNADVRDSLIQIDGKSYGFTPAVLQVPVGAHVVRVSYSGYRPIERKVVVSASKEQTLDVQLAEAQEVTAASRSTQTVEEAPASVSIVPGVELRAMGYPTIAEALRGVRGVYVTDDRAYSSIGIRGFSRIGDYGNHVLITVDGQPTNDDYIGSSYVGYDARVDLDDVQRIEVVRGPGSALYGTGAFFGVVNLVTRGRDEPTHVEAGVSAAEYGVARARVHATWKANDQAGVWVSFSGAHAPDGRDFTFPEYKSAKSDGQAIGVDDFGAETLTGRAWWKDLTFQFLWTDRKKTLPTGVSDTLFGSPDTFFHDTRAYGELRWDTKLGPDVEVMTRAHANVYIFEGQLAYSPADGGDEHDHYHGTWAGFEERVTAAVRSWAHVTLGGELQRHFTVHQQGRLDDGTTLIERNDPFWIGAGYAVLDLDAGERVRFSPAVRYDAYSTFGGSLNPRISVVTHPWRDGIVKAFVGKAFRAPSVYEMFYTAATQVPGLDLKPEDVWSGELEWSQRVTPTLTAIVAGYTNVVRNLIILGGDGTIENPNRYQNDDHTVRTYGGEFELRRDFRDGWMLSGQVSVQKTEYLQDGQSLLDFEHTAADKRHVPDSPSVLAGARGMVPLIARALLLSSRLTYIGPVWDRYENPSDPPQLRTNAALLWDVVFSGQAERAGFHWNFGVYNLLDARWAAPVSSEHLQRTILQNGRTLYASMALTF